MLSLIRVQAKSKPCKGMAGLIEEAKKRCRSAESVERSRYLFTANV